MVCQTKCSRSPNGWHDYGDGLDDHENADDDLADEADVEAEEDRFNQLDTSRMSAMMSAKHLR
jgi:hypothetical protein